MTGQSRSALLDWPLEGTHRIEASAGTGKTFALALLHTRLVVERELAVKNVLAVTYTIAATEELRERLRHQLGRAVSLALLDEGALEAKCASEDAAESITANVLRERRRIEEPAKLAARLRRAVAEVDLAPIHTIHAFCQRVLADHALASGEPLVPGEFVTSERALHDEIALDAWRRCTRDRETTERLHSLWPSPGALAKDLRLLLAADTLLPARAEPDPDALAALDAAADALRAACRDHAGDARRMIEAARANGVLHKGRPTDRKLVEMWAALAAFGAGGVLGEEICKSLDVLTPAGIADRVLGKHKATARIESPLLHAIDDYLGVRRAAARAYAEARANLLHDVRDIALARMAAIKRERGLTGFDDLVERVHAALSSEHGGRLAEALRDDYPGALVDEFQDTDAKQWSIFRRIYVGEHAALRPALFLIGDPKQAIYRFRGGDVHTYHEAGRDAESTRTLDRNFRSRPRMIEAVAAVFAEGGEFPFADDETRCPRVVAGGRVADGDLMDGKRVAPALHLLDLSRAPNSPPGPMRAVPARDLAAQAAATEIHRLLTESALALGDGKASRRVAPRDIAVLVNRNDEAVRMQRELAARGIASVTATRTSLFSTPEAIEIVRIFEALLALGDESRLRAALATVLVGADAVSIDALSHDEDAHRGWLDACQAWRQRWQRSGPLAFVSDLVAAASPRLLKLADGERRLTNYLQLAEAVQEAREHVLGEAGQADWLARRIASADDYDEAQQQRLESDAERVRIMTLHKAKGLEFDLVFLPFAGMAPADVASNGLCLIAERIDGQRALRARIDGLDDDEYAIAAAIEKRELLAEQLRLLYVGLTRARYAAWLYAGSVWFGERSALSWLLHRDGEGKVTNPNAEAIDAAFERLAKAAPKAIVRDPFPDLASRALPFPAEAQSHDRVREARRVLRRDWWVHSFSQLAREDAGTAPEATGEQGAEDEPSEPAALELVASPYVGARFGNALHAALETIDFARWRDWDGDAPPPGESDALRRALGANGYVDDGIAGGLAPLTELVRDTANARLPEGVRLADIAPSDRRAEIEFHFALHPVAVDRLVALLHAHGVVRGRDGFGARERLEGLMTGRIDLVYLHEDRAYLLDYKSNRLSDYSAQSLARAMRDSEYDLQYLIYALALHRWLRFRRADYDYDRHFGGVRYLFCRGLRPSPADPSCADTPGVFAARPSRALIEALDALLAPPQREVA
ncbi:MAG TPA: UvrD-helicase domain-containing protein [Rhodanobacteraceae bacterium]|nr:UvrD-helicase domain-containing protein [Rhodanobacteraceae bacterium]